MIISMVWQFGPKPISIRSRAEAAEHVCQAIGCGLEWLNAEPFSQDIGRDGFRPVSHIDDEKGEKRAERLTESKRAMMGAEKYLLFLCAPRHNSVVFLSHPRWKSEKAILTRQGLRAPVLPAP